MHEPEIKVGDIVIKDKGAQKGAVGVVTRIFNRNNDGYIILEVFCKGKILKWSQSWCEFLGTQNKDR